MTTTPQIGTDRESKSKCDDNVWAAHVDGDGDLRNWEWYSESDSKWVWKWGWHWEADNDNDTDTEPIDRRFPLAVPLIYGNANGRQIRQFVE